MRLSLPKSPLDPIFDKKKRSGSIDVGNTPPSPTGSAPVACFTVEIIAGVVHFDASCSTDDDGTIVAWAWDFGDGNTSTTGPTVTHVYEAVGIYDVTLVVTDDDGLDSDPLIESVGIGYDEILLGNTGPEVYYPPEGFETYDWSPYTYSWVAANNPAASSNLGRVWFDTWWDEVGHALGVSYDAALAAFGGPEVRYTPTFEDTTVPPFGGNVTTPGDGYRYHTFTADREFYQGMVAGVLYPTTVEVIVVGGGASGGRPNAGNQSGGGGGGGQAVIDAAFALAGTATAVTIGAGGAVPASGQGNDGGTTSFGSLSAVGGSGGGSPGVSSGAGRSGSGGGGGGGASTTIDGAGGAGTGGAGNGGAGDGNATASARRGGGGGGAGGNGTSGVAGGVGGNGGTGVEWPTGSGQYYGGGGGGGRGLSTGGGGAGGTGGGGAGGVSNTVGAAGAANRGGGGGGADVGGNLQQSGAGGSGVVILRYPWP